MNVHFQPFLSVANRLSQVRLGGHLSHSNADWGCGEFSLYEGRVDFFGIGVGFQMTFIPETVAVRHERMLQDARTEQALLNQVESQNDPSRN